MKLYRSFAVFFILMFAMILAQQSYVNAVMVEQLVASTEKNTKNTIVKESPVQAVLPVFTLLLEKAVFSHFSLSLIVIFSLLIPVFGTELSVLFKRKRLLRSSLSAMGP